MSAPNLNEFQKQVSELLLRHRSLLDVLSKYQQTNASVNRSVTKSITECGCLEINAHKQEYDAEAGMNESKRFLQTHVTGQLCESCMEHVVTELGRNLFYMSALCNLLEINLDDVVEREAKNCSTLGMFNLS